jgi:DNA-binding PadR family transcriptional regulator
MSLTHPDGEPLARLAELTAFQRDILWAMSHRGAMKGFAVKDELELYYDEAINHGRVYQNLDALVEAGYVAKHSQDGRTNEYKLTADAKQALSRRRTWIDAGEVVQV